MAPITATHRPQQVDALALADLMAKAPRPPAAYPRAKPRQTPRPELAEALAKLHPDYAQLPVGTAGDRTLHDILLTIDTGHAGTPLSNIRWALDMIHPQHRPQNRDELESILVGIFAAHTTALHTWLDAQHQDVIRADLEREMTWRLTWAQTLLDTARAGAAFEANA